MLSRSIDNKLGTTALVISNTSTSLILLWLRQCSSNAVQNLLILVIANFAVSLILLSSKVTERPIIPQKRPIRVALFLWVICYCINYSSFLIFPNVLTLSHFVIAQSLAPFGAVILTKEWKQEGNSVGQLLFSASPILLLLLISRFIPSPVDTESNFSLKWIAITVVFACSIISRTASRVISASHQGNWLTPRFSLLNGIVLSVILLWVGDVDKLTLGHSDFGNILLVATVIIIVQSLHLFGLACTLPVLSALAISTSVPISIFIDTLFSKTAISPPIIALSIGYCLCVAFKAKMEQAVDSELKI